MSNAPMEQPLLFPSLAKSSVYISLLAIGLGASPMALLPLLSATGIAAVYGRAGENRYAWWLILWPAAFVALSVLSVAVGVEPERGVLFLLSYLPCAVIFFIIVRLFDLRDLMRLFVSLTLLGGLISAQLVVLRLSIDASPSDLVEQAALPILGVPNDLAVLAMIAPFTAALFLRCRAWHLRWLWGALLLTAFLMSAAIIVSYQSRSALLALIIGLVVLALGLTRTMRSRAKLLAIIGAAALLGLLLDAVTGFGMLAKFSDPVRWTRLRLWLTSWQMFSDAPWLGQGAGSFSVLYEQYAAPLRLPDWVHWDDRHMPWAHNLYLELLAERGLLGALCFAGWITSLIVALARIMHREERLCTAAAALFAALCVVLAAGLVDLSLLRLWLVLMLTIVTAMTVVLVACAQKQQCPISTS